MIKVLLLRWIQNNVFYSASQNFTLKLSKCTVANFNSVINKTDKSNTANWKDSLRMTMKIYPDFIVEEEEISLMKEIDPYMQRLRYEFAHWDNAIHGYRETERRQWNEQNTKVINRIREKAFPLGMPQLSLVHVLDLMADGWIKPHVDSIRFCGDVIAGLSLLSDSVMRLTMVGHEQECREDFLLPRRSLYVMSGTARQIYNHEILKSEESYFQGHRIPRNRRVSIICRSEVDKKPEDIKID
ncbi:PREDICTED: alpha-ketoglutarate-dependent dioxygenase alkB homolog 7, mitochondrial-like isoform X3 [Polistes canadensis]|uniref:alpha-ketoglutarate-dependent dioxygenase alkB homolog 7, mitochondrial-like isoform X3 n=1 Tax=Polistes canadensis TaxID=91411 RepID=UPI000718F638|nr:PREDICTED: alpha-ketoglutarate-dependent dioxygenase alkB homolog 7, mitochondrial-like isoform X3 [Polistes canadensis]XP_014604830.1 PREDICTED: alpha-ketoglutarate-dependent dioxygenase alkB homolog 7, mitochondrial-like isoform X3 [Polistes canadensis]XP_014604831.1 PREDICTED: alpha-ketoglutarate-dependent dioxygenase alkB homolog 7, mitochondrial-like isoform X3 [Polistes canadensis]